MIQLNERGRKSSLPIHVYILNDDGRNRKIPPAEDRLSARLRILPDAVYPNPPRWKT